MRQQQWRISALRLGALFSVCLADNALLNPMLPAFAQDAGPRGRVKITGGPAQKGEKKAASADPASEAARGSYEALPLADRRAVQEALVWVENYKGTLDGDFGKRTRDALVAYEEHAGLAAHGVLDREKLKRLMAAARRAKEAVGFTAVSDPSTGMKLGLPLKLLTKRKRLSDGTSIFSAERSFSVDLRAIRGRDGGLDKFFERLRRDGADRKVTYKVSKPDWFVVSGEAGGQHFYTRFEQSAGTGVGELRGYTISYPAAEAATFDRIAIAIANSAEPFPASSPRLPAKEGDVRGGSAPAPAAQPRHSRPDATGVALAPDRVLSVLPAACAQPSRGGQKLRIVASDAASGLTLLDVPGTPPLPSALAQAALADAASLVIVGYAAGAGERPALTVASGEVRSAAGSDPAEARIFAPLQAGAGGSAVFDRMGTLHGVIGRQAATPRLVAGVAPQATHPLIAAGPLETFLHGSGVEATGRTLPVKSTAGEIVRVAARSMVAIDCALQ